VVQNADGLQKVTRNPRLSREVTRVCDDLGALRLELHAFTLFSTLLHCCFDTHGLPTLPEYLIDIGVQHVSATVDGRESRKALWKLAEAVERVDVW